MDLARWVLSRRRPIGPTVPIELNMIPAVLVV